MKFFFTTLLFFSITLSLPSQSLKIEREFNSSYYELNELEINLTADKISITKNNQNIFLENLSGKKIFKSSPTENSFLVANFQFSNNKADYPVELKVFDRNGEMILTYKFLAPYDLPHPLFTVNDDGILSLFDPLNFKVKIISKSSEKEVELEKEVPFEMEKASFIEMNQEMLFVLTSQRALDITESTNNVKLYKINLRDLSLDKKVLDYNTPTLLKIIDGNIFISGVKFENLKPIGKTLKYDVLLNQLSSNDKIIEKLISYGNKFYGKYFNSIYELRNDLSVLNEKKLFDGERILDLGILNDKLIVVTNVSGKNNLYSFLPGLSVNFKESLDIFKTGRIEDFCISGNNLIIHHDFKSVKIKTDIN
jgi:hypothetical protein